MDSLEELVYLAVSNGDVEKASLLIINGSFLIFYVFKIHLYLNSHFKVLT